MICNINTRLRFVWPCKLRGRKKSNQIKLIKNTNVSREKYVYTNKCEGDGEGKSENANLSRSHGSQLAGIFDCIRESYALFGVAFSAWRVLIYLFSLYFICAFDFAFSFFFIFFGSIENATIAWNKSNRESGLREMALKGFSTFWLTHCGKCSNNYRSACAAAFVSFISASLVSLSLRFPLKC